MTSAASLALVAVIALVLGVMAERLRRRWLLTQAAEQASEYERVRLAAAGAGVALWWWDLQSGRVHYGRAFAELLGEPAPTLQPVPATWLERVHPEDRAGLEAALAAHREGRTSTLRTEHRLSRRDGSWRWVQVRARLHGGVLAGALLDVTEQLGAQEQLQHDAFHDALTGLPNRALFADRLAGAVARSGRRRERLFAVLFLDLDGFKTVNDRLGHAAGDAMLRDAAERIKECVRPGDTVGRLGGDEFAILLDDINAPEDATEVADRIHRQLATPFDLEGQEVVSSASIGIVTNRKGYDSTQAMLRDADAAMYRAKKLGKSRHQIFDTAMHNDALAEVLLEAELRQAVEREQLQLVYQPVFHLASRRPVGVEAFLRWSTPARGVVPQSRFLPLAERTGLMVEIGGWALRQACQDAAKWSTLPPGLQVSVNLSPRQLARADLVEAVQRALAASALAPERLRLEVVEAAVIRDPQSAAAILCRLRALGVAVDIDDFGTGYSSLSCLRQLPVQRVKIDRTLIRGSVEDEHRREMVAAVIGLASSLGMETVAEGVESEDQARLLDELGCELAQGYLLGREIGAEEVAALLAAPPGIGQPAAAEGCS